MVDFAGLVIRTMFLASQIYSRPDLAASARAGGDFLVLAQLPEPQPGWAQQYNYDMHPIWARKFEPPAISSLESRYAINALLDLTERTGGHIPGRLVNLRSTLENMAADLTDRLLYQDLGDLIAFSRFLAPPSVARGG